MELIIVRDGHVFARATDDSAEQHFYELRTVSDADMPEYPVESAGKGKRYELDYLDGVLQWVKKDRPLTVSERMDVMQSQIDEILYPAWVQPTGVHDAYAKGARVLHNNKKWISTTDANVWEPGVYGWQEAEA